VNKPASPLTHCPVDAKNPALKFRALLIEGSAERSKLTRV
jgi:hypothetical protein